MRGKTNMNDNSARPMSMRRALITLGGLALVLGVILAGAGAWSGHRAMLWAGISALAVGLIWLICARSMPDEPMRTERRRYMREFLPAMGAYVALLYISQALLKHVHAVPLTVLLVLLPVLPIGFVVRAMVRLVLASDELERRLQLEAISIASITVGLLSFAAAFLRDAGLLPIDNGLMLVLPALFGTYGAANWWVRRRFRDE
jgi:FtsH-binding integral membrane protein